MITMTISEFVACLALTAYATGAIAYFVLVLRNMRLDATKDVMPKHRMEIGQDRDALLDAIKYQAA